MLESEEFADELLETLADEREKRGHLESRVAELSPKARYCDTILRCQNAIQVNIIAKDYGMSAVAFNRLLYNLKIQHRIADTWVLYQKYAGKGYIRSGFYGQYKFPWKRVPYPGSWARGFIKGWMPVRMWPCGACGSALKRR